MKKIFISHSSKDAAIMQAFIDDILHGALSVKISEIFCTTTDGTKIKSGSDWRNSIKDALISAKITFLLITPNYKESEVSLCEMGAAWVCSGVVVPLIVDPINYSTVGVLQQPNQVEKLIDEKSLDRIRDLVQEKLDIPLSEIRSDRWTIKKYEFIQKINKTLVAKPFLPALCREDYDKAIAEKTSYFESIKILIEEKDIINSKLEKIKLVKDIEQVKEIEREFSDNSLYEEFNSLCQVVGENLRGIAPIIVGIIFKTYTDKDVTIQWKGWREQIDEARARDYITDDLYADWSTTKRMGSIYTSLNALGAFIRKNSEEASFSEVYYVQSEAPLSISNLEFWEEAFDVKVYLS